LAEGITAIAIPQQRNEAFAAQGLTVTRQLGLADDDARVNTIGGAIVWAIRQACLAHASH